jgi:hypothetical protein
MRARWINERAIFSLRPCGAARSDLLREKSRQSCRDDQSRFLGRIGEGAEFL